MFDNSLVDMLEQVLWQKRHWIVLLVSQCPGSYPIVTVQKISEIVPHLKLLLLSIQGSRWHSQIWNTPSFSNLSVHLRSLGVHIILSSEFIAFNEGSRFKKHGVK